MFTDSRDFEQGCRQLAGKIKHYLITVIGKTLEEASAKDIYQAFALSLREEVMLHWLSTWRTYKKARSKIVCYLSMEYLPGKLTQGVVTNLGADRFVARILEMIARKDCLEQFQERDPALGNGGLGRLASCIMDSLATGAYPAIGYGLRYQYGLFEQELWAGQQIERPDWWLEDISPWEFRREARSQLIQYFGRLHLGKNIWSEEVGTITDAQNVLAMPFDIPVVGFRRKNQYNVNTLRLWSTREGPRNFELQRFNAGELDNAAENMTLTDVLYPADHHDVGKRLRLKQEFLLVSASVKDIIRRHKGAYGSCDQLPDKIAIQINDTHPALSVAEMIHQLTAVEQMPWAKAVEITQATIAYTNHTILKEALEEWSQLQVQTLLPRQYRIIERLNQEFCEQVRSRFSNDEEAVRRMSILQDGRVKMAHLALVGSHKVNGVAKLHTQILKDQVFSDFNAFYPEKILSITNGVTPRKWIYGASPELAQFITERIGEGWITDLSQIKKLEEYATDSASLLKLLDIKRNSKERLIHYLQNHLLIRDFTGHGQPFRQSISPDMIFDVQIKRMHEYKRQFLNLIHVISMYQEMIENPQARLPRFVLFAGKAAASYEKAKNIIHLIASVASVINADTRLQDRLKVAFVDNYNVSLAEKIIPAADLSEQISTAGMEASGTGNMKLSLNGALTIGTDDGANVEMREAIAEAWPFGFGASADEIHRLKTYGYNPQSIYENNPRLRKALDSLRDGTFAQNENEARIFESLFYSLLGIEGGQGDAYFILHDFESYERAQRKVDQIYADPPLWARLSLLNIARMGDFSIDRCVDDYARLVWGVKPQQVDEKIFDSLLVQFNEYVACPI